MFDVSADASPDGERQGLGRSGSVSPTTEREMHPSVQPDVLRTELSGSVYYLVSSDRGTSGASRSFDDFRDLRIMLEVGMSAHVVRHLNFPVAGPIKDEFDAIARLKGLRSWLEGVCAQLPAFDGLDKMVEQLIHDGQKATHKLWAEYLISVCACLPACLPPATA